MMMRENSININEESCSIDEEMTAVTTTSNGGGQGTPKWEKDGEEAATTQEVMWFGVEDPNECTFGQNTSMMDGGGGGQD